MVVGFWEDWHKKIRPEADFKGTGSLQHELWREVTRTV
jgi:hypothetical protein